LVPSPCGKIARFGFNCEVRKCLPRATNLARCICRDMKNKIESTTILPDPAAVFASALSLWQVCQKHAVGDTKLNLSECYNGMDQYMREVMRVASQFETWACLHIDFDELNDMWPYLLEDRFGENCLAVLSRALSHSSMILIACGSPFACGFQSFSTTSCLFQLISALPIRSPGRGFANSGFKPCVIQSKTAILFHTQETMNLSTKNLAVRISGCMEWVKMESLNTLLTAEPTQRC